MNREEYQQVKQIFQSALDVAPDNLADFLNEKCSDNPNIRHEVEKLLSSFDSDYLEQPAVEKFAETISKSNLSIGQEIGHYKIIKKIGAGGMGEVFLAEDVRLKRKIALKILPVAVSRNKNYLRRFEQEACAASALNHPNILTVHEFGGEEGTNFIASEFVEGETLRERLRGSEAIVLPEILDIVLQVAAALSAAHDAGIIHRDIKPENVMLRADGLVKVLDFGLAKLILKKNEIISGEDTTQINTTPGMIMGTVSYMSPEQARGKKTDARSDIWSLGVVLYEMLAGGTPFAGETTSDTIASILTREPAPLDENIPAELQRILRKALQKKLDERYQTVKDLLLDLKEIKTELEFQGKLGQSYDPINKEAKTQTYKQTETTDKTINETAPEHTFQAFTVQYSFYFQTAFVALIAIAGVSIWWFAFGRDKQSTTDSTSAGSFKSSQITNWASAAGEIGTSAAFSHNGKFITFSSTKSGINSIWVKQTNAGDPIQVTKDEFLNRYPVFSPDGEEIVYFSRRGDSLGFWRVAQMGGQPKLVTDKIDVESQPKLWSKSGKIYFQNHFNLFAVDVESGEVSGITNFPKSATSPNTFSISADESQIAFVTLENESWKIMVKSVNSPETRQIIESKPRILNLVWHPDGKKLLFSKKTDEFNQIYSISLDGGEPVQISSGDSDVFVQDVSPNGERILFSSMTETSDLWKIDTETAKESLTASQIDGELWADISPDNGSIVYQSIRNLLEGNNLFNGSIVKQSISKDSERLQLVEDGFLPNWSPDGETVAFLKLVGKDYEIWKVAKTGDLVKRISTGEIQDVESAVSPYLTTQVKYLSWSPKGSGLAFPAKREGISNIWLASVDGSGERKLSDNQDQEQRLSCPFWSSDETGIAFSSQKIPNSGGKAKYFIWFYDLTTNTQRKILELDEDIRFLGWAKNKEELIFAVMGESKTSILTWLEVPIRAVSVKTGKVRNLTVLKDAYFYNIYLSPDKGSVGFTSRSGGNDNVWISPLEGGEPRKLTENNDPRLYFSSLAWSPDDKTIYFGKQTRFTLLSMLINQKVLEKKK